MPDTATTAIISASGGIVVALIGATLPQIMNRASEKRRFYPSPRATSIDGIWEGGGVDTFTENKSDFLEFKLKIEFKNKSSIVTGLGELAGVSEQLNFEGGFHDDSYLQLIYKTVDPSKRQIGVITFRLSADGRTLKGYYAGYSPKRETFIVGRVELTKHITGKL